MGHAANERNVLLCLGGLETVLAEMGVVTPGRALTAARAIYSEQPRAKAA
jgi:alanine-glyoxylate transaminase / serine-glyoxylate transaminase / serine-pyruvate transaminase